MSPLEFDRIVTIINPNSSEAKRTEAEVLHRFAGSEFAKEYGGSIATKNTSPADNIDLVAGELRGGDLAVICGGDGLAHIAANAMIRSGVEDGKMLFLPYGAYNDAARAFLPRYKDPVSAIRNGRELSATTLEIECDDTTETRHALTYASLGLTALVARTINQPEYRQRRRRSRLPVKLYDSLQLTKMVRQAPVFEYESEGEAHAAHELFYGNGKNLAGYIGIDSGYESPDVRRTEIAADRSNIKYLADIALQLSCGLAGSGLRGETAATDSITLTSPAYFQYDGEAEKLAAGTGIRFQARPNSLQVITSK